MLVMVVLVQGITHSPALHHPVSSVRPLSQVPSGCMEGASLAALALTQFIFLLTRTQKVRIYHPSESRGSSSAVPAGYYSRHRQVMSRGKKKLNGDHQSQKFTLALLSDIMLSQSGACQQSSRREARLQIVLRV
jgi:hypothetical protein